MLTTKGKLLIKKFLFNQNASLAGALAFGSSDATATVTDPRLSFEFARTPVDTVSYDFTNNFIILKGTIPATVTGKFYEVGLYSAQNSPNTVTPPKTFCTFDSVSEGWTLDSSGSWNTTVSRIGNDCLKHTPAANSSAVATRGNIQLGFGNYLGTDTFLFSYFVNNANTSNIKVRMMSDSANYYEFSFAPSGTGYKVTALPKSSVTVTGSPGWENITQVQVITTSGSGGASEVYYDGIRVEDTSTVSVDYGLMSHFILATPVVKTAAMSQDFEYNIKVTI